MTLQRYSVSFSALTVLLSACGANDIPLEPEAKDVAAITPQVRAHSHEGCGDHDGEETPELRELAARPVSWSSSKWKRKHGTLQAKIVGFNDFHGALQQGALVANRPVGGAAVLAAYLKAATAGFEGRSLTIHAGDHVGASPPSSALLQDEPSIQFLNLLSNERCKGPVPGRLECDMVGTPGNHEFDEGSAELLRLIYGGNHPNGPFLQRRYRGADFPYVSANVVDSTTGEHLLPPYVMRKLDGVKVGVIGAVLEQTPQIVTPSGVAGLTFLDEVTAINQQVRALKRARVRTIIVTIHQGARQAPTYTGPTDPAATVGSPISDIVSELDDEVDVVISGHAHQFTNALVNTANGHPILVVQAFSNGTAYDDIDLEIDRATGDVVSKTARVITTFSDVAPGNQPDADVAALAASAKALTAPLENELIATFEKNLAYPELAPNGDMTRTQTSAGESQLGNLIADAQRTAMGTDFGFMNPGGIRQELFFAANTTIYPADQDGQALWGELFTIQPFGNSLVRMTLTGAQIVDLLEQQFTVNRMLQISGLEYTWDASLPVGSRVVSVLQSGVAIDPSATYTVTANSFIAAGGDGFTVFLQGTNVVGGPVDLDALIEYLTGLPQPFSAPAIGRITRLN